MNTFGKLKDKLKEKDPTKKKPSAEKAKKPNARVKNPCKICSETVDIEDGLQCKGACKKWAHFECLKFSPTQIDDIQSGDIKINCPCPDCENDSKANQSENSKNKEYRSKQNDCDKTFCPGIPLQKSALKTSCNPDAFNQTSKPLPYGITEGTSYEYFVRNETQDEIISQRVESEQSYVKNDREDEDEEQVDEDEEQEDEDVEQEDEDVEQEDEEKSYVEVRERKYQTVLMAQSSSQIKQGKCCTTGPCIKSSSSSSQDSCKIFNKKGKDKKKKKDKKDKKEKKEKKQKKQKKTKNDKNQGSPCCQIQTRCCNEPSGSSNSDISISSTNSTGKKSCLPEGTSIQVKSKAVQPCRCDEKYGKLIPTNPNCPPQPRSPLNSRSPPMPRSSPMPRSPPTPRYAPMPRMPQPYGAQSGTCPPECRGMKPLPSQSNCPSYCPGPGGAPCHFKVALHKEFSSKGFQKGGPCLPEFYDPIRRTTVLSKISSTQLLYLSPSNRSKSFCTLDRPNKKEGTNISTEISAHVVKINNSDTKIWQQQQINEYKRKMVLLALERMCQTMGQFSVQFRELMNKMTEKTNTKS